MLSKHTSFLFLPLLALSLLLTTSLASAHTLLHSSPTDPIILTKGTPSVVEALTKSSAVYYSFTIATGTTNLAITTTGSTGDADIYLNKDKVRNTKTSTWKSIGSKSTERIALSAPVPGTYFFTLRAYTATTNTTVTLSYTTPTPIAMCSYAAPPAGCTYVPGTSYNATTGCGRVLSCTATTSPVTTTPTPIATNGSCGTSSGVLASVAPSTNLCTSGTASTVSGTGPYTWTCSGTNGGLTAMCNAPKPVTTTPTPTVINGSCGSSANQTLASIPTTNLCASGTATVVTDSSMYMWSCTGSSSGTTVSCHGDKTVTTVPTTPVVSNGGGTDKPIPNSYTPGWTYCSPLYTGGCTFSGLREIRFGSGSRWVTKRYYNGFPGWHCHPDRFGVPQSMQQSTDHCEMANVAMTGTLAAPITTQHGGSYPTIDLTAIPLGKDGISTLQIEPTTDFGLANSDIGAFRIPCAYSHMAFNDPIVYPGQTGKSHLHMFFGNTSSNAYSTAQSLATTGDSTCAGGIANRSSYWVPALIDTAIGKPIVPTGSLWYYKTAYGGVRPADVKAVPAGLRMIAGDMNATTEQPMTHWECYESQTKRGPSIPNCGAGDSVGFTLSFPQCWDGVNLDSANHKSHMAYATGSGCPNTHPVALPEISLNIQYSVKVTNEALNWRLSSDHDGLPSGYSSHGDFFDGWNRDVMNTFVTNCLNQSKDCHAYLLGNGTTLSE